MRRLFANLCLTGGLLSAVTSLCAQSQPAAAPPPIEQIVSNVVAHAHTVSLKKDPVFAYKQTTVIEELDSSGSVKERKEKLYDVKLIGGMPKAKLLLVNGKKLTGKQLKSEQEADRKRAQHYEEKKSKKNDEVEVLVSQKLVDRYKFQYQHQEEINGRQAYVLSFQPRSDDLPVDRMQDRVLNKVSGLVWVDCQDFEIARAELHLSETVKLWGGLLGSLEVFNLELNRERSPYGVWYNHLGTLQIEGRKLLSPLRYKARESTDGFHLFEQ